MPRFNLVCLRDFSYGAGVVRFGTQFSWDSPRQRRNDTISISAAGLTVRGASLLSLAHLWAWAALRAAHTNNTKYDRVASNEGHNTRARTRIQSRRRKISISSTNKTLSGLPLSLPLSLARSTFKGGEEVSGSRVARLIQNVFRSQPSPTAHRAPAADDSLPLCHLGIDRHRCTATATDDGADKRGPECECDPFCTLPPLRDLRERYVRASDRRLFRSRRPSLRILFPYHTSSPNAVLFLTHSFWQN